jgi:hypothetical protein
MTNSRALSIANDQQRLSSSMQLRSSIAQVIELGGNGGVNQIMSPDAWNTVSFGEVLRQSGAYTNFYFPVRFPNNPAVGIIYTYLTKVTVSGYYQITFKYSFDIIAEAYCRLGILSNTTLIRYETQLLPVGNQGVATWTTYIEANQNIAIYINPAALIRINPNDFNLSPRLIISQIAQLTDNTAGQASTMNAVNTTQSIPSGTTTTLNFDNIPDGYLLAQNPTETWSNTQGGGNQLGFINSTFTKMIVKKNSLYYITASSGIGYLGGGGQTGGRSLMIIKNGTTVLAVQATDVVTLEVHALTVAATAYLQIGDEIQVAILQNSGFAQDATISNIQSYPRFSIIDLG